MSKVILFYLCSKTKESKDKIQRKYRKFNKKFLVYTSLYKRLKKLTIKEILQRLKTIMSNLHKQLLIY